MLLHALAHLDHLITGQPVKAVIFNAHPVVKVVMTVLLVLEIESHFRRANAQMDSTTLNSKIVVLAITNVKPVPAPVQIV